MLNVESLIERAANDVAKSRYAIALTGAGMSTESGIPDFRGPNGIWTKNPEAERLAYQTYYKFQRNPKEYWEQMITGRSLLGDLVNAQPNPGHYALTKLEQIEVLRCVLTQNIDGLHVKAGNKRVLEYHGSVHKLRCPSCGARFERDDKQLLELVAKGQLPPLCKQCRSPIKDDIVHFNEPIPADVAQESLEETARCDLMLICGTSAVIYPFAQLPRLARQRSIKPRGKAPFSMPEVEVGVTIIEVNAEPTPLTAEGVSDYLIRGKTAELLPLIADKVEALVSRK